MCKPVVFSAISICRICTMSQLSHHNALLMDFITLCDGCVCFISGGAVGCLVLCGMVGGVDHGVVSAVAGVSCWWLCILPAGAGCERLLVAGAMRAPSPARAQGLAPIHQILRHLVSTSQLTRFFSKSYNCIMTNNQETSLD